MTQTSLQQLFDLPELHDAGTPRGIVSVCSAHPLVIEAALAEAFASDTIALIEATCNQVNQDGGYTGMTPVDFRNFVLEIAGRVDFPIDRILFGGDHLGPNPWRAGPASDAMRKAIAMTRDYAAAGFSKIHLDASMACADDPSPLASATIASRAAVLAKAAEEGATKGGHPPPAYIIGTEVPIPGGATEELDVLQVTSPTDASATLDLHREAFLAAGLGDAFNRAIGLVVQPGVEFGHANVIAFAPRGAKDLSDWRAKTGNVVFEAHSTDYQTTEALTALVEGGFAILKVGPGLTFALREALYGLDQIAGLLCESYSAGTLPAEMEQIMCDAPQYWQDYYHGTPSEQRLNRHFSYSDRIRYYWTDPKAEAAVENLFQCLEGLKIPETLVSQYLARQYAGVVAGETQAEARALARAAVRFALAPYSIACGNL